MLLTFSIKKFKGLIKNGRKIHSIRKDTHRRWKVGMKVHFWMGNPRNIKQNPHAFGEGIVAKVIDVYINPKMNLISVNGYGTYKTIDSLNEIAVKDGFTDWEEMKSFFPEEFNGRMILWRDCKWFDDDKTSFMSTYETISENKENLIGEQFYDTITWLRINNDKYLKYLNDKPIIWEGYRYIKKIVITKETTTEELADAMNDESLTLFMTDLTNLEEYEKAKIVLNEIKKREEIKNNTNGKA